MLKDTVFIEKPRDEVWDFIVMEFAKAFKTSPSKIQEKTHKVKAGKNRVDAQQRITVLEKPTLLKMETFSPRDIVTLTYELHDDEDGCFVTLIEEGKGNKNPIRTLAYSVRTLPLFRGRKKQVLRARLEAMKNIIENEKKA